MITSFRTRRDQDRTSPVVYMKIVDRFDKPDGEVLILEEEHFEPPVNKINFVVSLFGAGSEILWRKSFRSVFQAHNHFKRNKYAKTQKP